MKIYTDREPFDLLWSGGNAERKFASEIEDGARITAFNNFIESCFPYGCCVRDFYDFVSDRNKIREKIGIPVKKD